MRWMKWIGIVSAMLLAAACFMPWVTIESKHLVISGMDSSGTNFGKPGYFHLLMVFFYILLTLVAKLWATRCNLFVVAINLGWAIRNFLMISQCRGGDCPLKRAGIYCMLFASLLMLIAAMFPDMKLMKQEKKG
jgi:hypothetical protein